MSRLADSAAVQRLGLLALAAAGAAEAERRPDGEVLRPILNARAAARVE